MDLRTSYMGLHLRNPLVASASPISHTVKGVHRLAEAGVGAVVLHSLFEEELDRQNELFGTLGEAGSESFAESLSYFPDVPGFDAAPRRYLDLIERAASVVDIPVIASLNGATPGGWTAYARNMQEAGAAALELNLYSPPAGWYTTGRDVEDRQVEIVGLVKAAVSVPVAVKLSPYYSSVGEMTRRFADAGADAIVLFNRFLHPDIDPQAVAVVPGIGLSNPADGRVARTWIALLRNRLNVDVAASTGVDGPGDVIAHLLAGADVVMSTSALLRYGVEHAEVLLEGLIAWMATRGFSCLADFRGALAVPLDTDEAAGERSAYVAAMRAANARGSGPY